MRFGRSPSGTHRWDTDEPYKSGKAVLRWIRHDAGMLLRLEGQAQGVAGQISADIPLSWLPWQTVCDPFVDCLGFTVRATRLMRL